jgi:hypothetical protein
VPKRVLDFDAMWGSDKLACCADWAQAEYAWLYGLADASGCFEITNLRVIWGRVAAIRGNLTIERLEQVFVEFQDRGLLFVWEHEGKRYAHWTGSDVPGRLPPPSWRMRLERFAPPVPKQRLAEYMSRFARGRAALAGVGFRGGEECAGSSAGGAAVGTSTGGRTRSSAASGAGETGLKGRVERAQGQDLDLNLDVEREGESNRVVRGETQSLDDEFAGAKEDSGINEPVQTELWTSNTNSSFSSNPNSSSDSQRALNSGPSPTGRSDWPTNPEQRPEADSGPGSRVRSHLREGSNQASWLGNKFDSGGMSAKELALARELRVGQGPVCLPKGVKPEVIERDRLRELARAKAL